MVAKATGLPAVAAVVRAGVQPCLEPAQDIDAIQSERADDGARHGGEPGAGLAVGAEREPPSDCRPPEQPFGEVVIEGRPGPVEEDAQPLAMAQQRAQRLALARRVMHACELPFGCRQAQGPAPSVFGAINNLRCRSASKPCAEQHIGRRGVFRCCSPRPSDARHGRKLSFPMASKSLPQKELSGFKGL